MVLFFHIFYSMQMDLGAKMKREYEFGIGRKILVMLLVVSILPILSIQIFSYRMNTTTIKNQTKELLVANLEQSSRSVDDFLATYDRIIMNIYTDSDYVKYLESINLWESHNYYVARHEIISRLQSIAHVNRELLGIALVGRNGEPVFYDAVTLSGVRSYCFDVGSFRRESLYKDSMNGKTTIYSGTVRRSDTEYGERNCFYIAHQLTDFNNYQKGAVGSIILCVDESALRSVYHQEGAAESNLTFIVNRAGDIVSFPHQQYLGRSLFAGGEEDLSAAAKQFLTESGVFSPSKMQINIRSIRDGEFLILNAQDLDYALKNANDISAIIVLIGVLMAMVCIIISLTFAGVTDRSVKKIISAMNRMTLGNYNQGLEISGSDEFAQIAGHFNTMQQKLVAASAQERDALVRQKNAEIRSLEAQINPHFLYNTLDAINWVALEREEFKISKMLTSLATILRYSIHKSNEIVPIAGELEYLRKYIYLQQQRFDYSFQCVIDADDAVLPCRIHKLLVQPLIENAIVHGFPGHTGADEITISVRKIDGERIELRITDNGRGMDKSLVELFNSFDYLGQQIETSIGVRNVITRIKLYYGDKGHFHIESGGSGTSVTVWIPFE